MNDPLPKRISFTMSVPKINFFVGLKAGKEESGKVDWKAMSKDKVAALSQMFYEVGTKAGRAAGMSVGKLAIAKVQVKVILTTLGPICGTQVLKHVLVPPHPIKRSKKTLAERVDKINF